ncbi:TPA: MFS transporter [Pseudomonas aeruginosa]
MTAPVHQYSNEERRKRIFAIVGASSGNLVEWFDFYVYAFCAIYFAPAFFPSDNPTVQLLNTAGVFAAGFLMRPIGTLAPALLLLARMFQGLSVGGEYGTSATYMSEVALKGQRGFFASFQYVTLIGGQLLAVLVVVILQQLLSEDELRAWGWRIPFVIGAITAVIALWLRRSLNETASKSTLERKESGTFAELFKHKRAFFTVLGFTAGGSLIFYTFTTYMQKYLVNTAGMSAKTASAVMTFALLAYMLMQPLFGMLSDRIGRKTSMLWFGTLGTLCTLPILLALKTVSSPYMAFFLIILALAIVSLYTSISGLIKAEMFPPEVRALGVGVSYAVGNAIFGGSAEYVALGLKSVGMENVFYWYVSAMCLLALLVCVSLPDLRKVSYLNDEP